MSRRKFLEKLVKNISQVIECSRTCRQCLLVVCTAVGLAGDWARKESASVAKCVHFFSANIGSTLLQALLEHWPKAQYEDVQGECATLASFTGIILSSVKSDLANKYRNYKWCVG